MRRRMRVLGFVAVLVAAVAGNLPARAADVDRLMQGSFFCDTQPQFRPGPAVIDGPSSQIGVHTGVLQPAFAAACRAGSGLVTYLGTGEQAGINAIMERRAERAFGTADIPLTLPELVAAVFDQRAPDRRGRTVVLNQIPIFVTVHSVAYNLSCALSAPLNLRSPVLSAIYTGTITRWNDRLLVLDNPGLASCDVPIRMVKRADFAGATLTFKDYLSKRNPIWHHYKQTAQNQSWPTITNACPALDEDGMAECIATTQNSIGYVQYHTARVSGLKTARLDSMASQADPARAFIAPSPTGCTEAAASAFVLPPARSQRIPVPGTNIAYETPQFAQTQADWSSVSLTDAPRGYPLCSFGYAFVYQLLQTAYFGQSYSPNTARTAADYLWVALSVAGQTRLSAYDFGPLPQNVLDVARVGVESIRFQS